MGQNNRQRRATKHRQRIRDQGQQQPHAATYIPADPSSTRQLLDELVRRSIVGASAEAQMREFLARPQQHQHAAVDAEFDRVVNAAIGARWTPLDLYEMLRRKSASPAAGHVLDLVAGSTARHPDRLVDPRWRAQLEQFGATARPTSGVSLSAGWAARAAVGWSDAVAQFVSILGVMCFMPRVEQVLPKPGSLPTAATPPGVGVDAKVLRRVRALLAKAESTEHEPEADALTAKAQQLMTRYAIDRTVAEAYGPVPAEPVARRLWLDAPYVAAKSTLISAVGSANHCRTILFERWGFVTVLGHDPDLDVVELLATSLLVQAARSMQLAGSSTTRSGVSRTRSFRQSFLAAYADRIGERLRESAQTTAAEVDTDHGGGLLPVLAARDARVDDLLAELYPRLRGHSVSVSNADGWGAGRAAADLARLDIRPAVGQRTG